MDAILFDLDGVLYQGDDIIPGAPDALRWVRSRNIPHAFVTNTTSRPRHAIHAKLDTLGLPVRLEQIITPPLAAARWLEHHARGPVALFVPDATQDEFSSLTRWDARDTQPPAAVVIGDLGRQWDFTRLNLAFSCLMREPHPILVALGMTRYWKTPEGLQLDAGPFVVALEYATGITPQVLGKPAAAFFQVAADSLGSRPERIWMVGDDIRGDVEGAQRAGLLGVQVKTGKFRPGDLETGIRPDALLESVADLPDWWGTLVDNPGE